MTEPKMQFVGTAKASTATPTNDLQAKRTDAYAAMRATYPTLANLTKETFADYSSLVTAFLRGVEATKPDAIVHDPFAAALAGAPGKALMTFFPGMQDDPESEGYIALRHRLMDDAIERDLDPAIHQVVLLGAGMDTRSYRLQRFAGCHVFELDSCQELADHKKRVLVEQDATLLAKAHDVIITDLATYQWPEQLVTRGFDAQAPTLWIVEGFLTYMQAEAIDRVFQTIDKLSAPRSQLLTDMCGTGAVDIEFTVSANQDVVWTVDTTLNEHQGGVLRALPWQIEPLLRRDANANYSGTQWDPKTFARFQLTEEQATLGPLLIALCTKPTQEPAP